MGVTLARTLVPGLLMLAACKDTPPTLEQLVPNGATAVLRIDGTAVLRSTAYAELFASASQQHPKLPALLAGLKQACQLDLQALESSVLAVEALSEGMMLAVRMPNIGTSKALKCASARLTHGDAAPAFTVTQQDGRAKLEFGRHAVGWAIDDNTLVVSSTGWSRMVKERTRGAGKAAVDNRLAKAMTLVDHNAPVWAVGKVPGLATAVLKATPAQGVQYGAMNLQLGDGLKLAATIVLASETQATDLRTYIDQQQSTLAPRARRWGLPAAVFDTVELRVEGAKLLAKVRLSLADLRQAATALSARL